MIIQFLINRRIRSHLQLMKNEFTSLSRDERACSILMAAEYLLDMEKSCPDYLGVLLSPEAYTSVECYRAYEQVAMVKRDAEKAYRTLQCNQPNLDWGHKHAKLHYVAILFLLARLAPHIFPKHSLDARAVGKILIDGISEIDYEDHAFAIKYYRDWLVEAMSKGDVDYVLFLSRHNRQDLKELALELISC